MTTARAQKPDAHNVDWPAFLPDPSLLQTTSAERRRAGQVHFSEMLMVLLGPVSHPQLSALADWACNETCVLHTSQISLLRNNKAQMVGTKVIDALGRVNQAAWVARERPELLPHLGCGPLTPKIERILKAYRPLLDPVNGDPLGSGAFQEVFLGLRQLPIPTPRCLRAGEALRLTRALGDWLEREVQASGLTVREAGRRLQTQWSGDSAGAKRLLRVLAGLEDYTSKQVAGNWEQIGLAICGLLGREGNAWTLAEEILGQRGGGKGRDATGPAVAKAAVQVEPGDKAPAASRGKAPRQRKSTARPKGVAKKPTPTSAPARGNSTERSAKGASQPRSTSRRPTGRATSRRTAA